MFPYIRYMNLCIIVSDFMAAGVASCVCLFSICLAAVHMSIAKDCIGMKFNIRQGCTNME